MAKQTHKKKRKQTHKKKRKQTHKKKRKQTHKKKRKSGKSKPKSHNARPSTASASTAIVVARPPERPWEIDNEQLTILKNSIAKGATDEELKYCLTVSRRYKLDPFKTQIWFIKRWDRGADNGKGGTGAYVWTPQVGIYGMAHIAARDHADYGSISKPEYGPTMDFVIDGHKIKAPQWASVKVWKKGLAEPSVGEAWFEEYCPKSWDNARLFWATMQHRMIAKCAKAQGLREAYPDLGGLYIPEECQRVQGDFTESGRQIVEASEPAYVPRRLDENAPHGHPPESEKARQAEAQLAKVEAEDRKYQESQKASQTTPVIDVPPVNAVPKANPVPPMAPVQYQGEVEIDWSDLKSPVVRGDLSNLLPMMQKHCKMKWEGDWWHCEPADVPTIMAMCQQLSFRVKEVHAAKSSAGSKSAMTSPAGATKGSGGTGTRQSQPTTPVVVKGTVEQANPESGKNPRMSILFKSEGKKYWMKAWNDKFFPWLVSAKEKNLPCEVFVEVKEKYDKTFRNIVGLKLIGSQGFDDDGKTPVIQRKDQEAGGRTLF